MEDQRLGRSVDVFGYGLVLHFCLTGGKHAFGQQLERDYNIMHVGVTWALQEAECRGCFAICGRLCRDLCVCKCCPESGNPDKGRGRHDVLGLCTVQLIHEHCSMLAHACAMGCIAGLMLGIAVQMQDVSCATFMHAICGAS